MAWYRMGCCTLTYQDAARLVEQLGALDLQVRGGGELFGGGGGGAEDTGGRGLGGVMERADVGGGGWEH